MQKGTKSWAGETPRTRSRRRRVRRGEDSAPIEPVLSLAFSVHSNPGVYALLLGSGVSRPAGIPTGWEVLIDLVRKLAAMLGESAEPDPAAWFRRRFGRDPDYPRVLEALAASPVERARVMQSYFEPTPEEKEAGLKVPGAAHRAIAGLVAEGYVRAIVTTNFDRLLEKALEAAGIAPTIVSTPEAAEGVLPLQHVPVLLLKVHGDVLDPGARNTARELDAYDPRIDRLLDRIFDEHGLVVCGWSAEWDAALRRALERSPGRRFTTYWTVRGDPGPQASRLIGLRGARLVRIRGADSFFAGLAEKVASLSDLSARHPLSPKVAVATLERYIARPEARVRLATLVSEETERLCADLAAREDLDVAAPFSAQELDRRLGLYETSAEALRALLTAGAFWGGPEHRTLWVRSLERVLNLESPAAGTEAWLRLRAYPALLLLYSAGLACVAQAQYGTLWILFSQVRSEGDGGDRPAVLDLHPSRVAEPAVARRLPGMAGRHTPLSDRLFEGLREPLRVFLPDARQYERSFDRFEYLLALAHADLARTGRAPIGRFGWRRRVDAQGYVGARIADEVVRHGSSWLPLTAGFFDRSPVRFEAAHQVVDRIVAELPWG